MQDQKTYGALWDYQNEVKTGILSIEAATEACKQKRDVEASDLKKQGYKVSKSTLKNQLRPYWGYMDPCGMSCTCYVLNIN